MRTVWCWQLLWRALLAQLLVRVSEGYWRVLGLLGWLRVGDGLQGLVRVVDESAHCVLCLLVSEKKKATTADQQLLWSAHHGYAEYGTCTRFLEPVQSTDTTMLCPAEHIAFFLAPVQHAEINVLLISCLALIGFGEGC